MPKHATPALGRLNRGITDLTPAWAKASPSLAPELQRPISKKKNTVLSAMVSLFQACALCP